MLVLSKFMMLRGEGSFPFLCCMLLISSFPTFITNALKVAYYNVSCVSVAMQGIRDFKVRGPF